MHMQATSPSSIEAEQSFIFPSEAFSSTDVPVPHNRQDMKDVELGASEPVNFMEEVKRQSTVKIVIIMASLCVRLYHSTTILPEFQVLIL